LDAVALRAVALDGEVREVEVAQVDAGTDDDLDDRLAAADPGDDRGATAVQPERALNGAVDVDHDRLGDRIGPARQLGDIAAVDRCRDCRSKVCDCRCHWSRFDQGWIIRRWPAGWSGLEGACRRAPHPVVWS